jgi:GNAT superfamily N-acetyltransferase
MTRPEPALRRAVSDDTERCFRLFWASIGDLATRLNSPWEHTADEGWPHLRPLFEFLAEHAAEWWVAEDATDGTLLGYARSIERGDLFELSEFFVDPPHQSTGIGGRLLDRAFPPGRGGTRAIIATSDMRAVARYHRAGTSIQFPFLGLIGRPSADARLDGALLPVRVEPGDATGAAEIAAIERDVLGYDRGTELEWLLATREGYLYRRPDGDGVVGFAFVGRSGAGPIASRAAEDQAPMLLHVEERTAALGRDELNIDIPAPNVVAIGHLLERGFRLEPSVNFLMADRAFGRFDRFIGYSPPFIL